ncbi:MAG TPA: hypothetical protein PLN81_09645, partial [Bacillota bacterium]|nr:hypothetical protein [Bacillota bacterium]
YFTRLSEDALSIQLSKTRSSGKKQYFGKGGKFLCRTAHFKTCAYPRLYHPFIKILDFKGKIVLY